MSTDYDPDSGKTKERMKENAEWLQSFDFLRTDRNDACVKACEEIGYEFKSGITVDVGLAMRDIARKALADTTRTADLAAIKKLKQVGKELDEYLRKKAGAK